MIIDVVDEHTRLQTVDFMAQLAPSGNSVETRIGGGMNSIPESMREIVTQSSITFPVSGARAAIGTWQGIYLCENSTRRLERKLTITVMGDEQEAGPRARNP